MGDIKVSMFTASATDHAFEPILGQIKDFKICICCFSAKHATLRRIKTMCPSGATVKINID